MKKIQDFMKINAAKTILFLRQNVAKMMLKRRGVRVCYPLFIFLKVNYSIVWPRPFPFLKYKKINILIINYLYNNTKDIYYYLKNYSMILYILLAAL